MKLLISSSKKELSYQGAQEIKKKLSLIKDLEILGPVDSPIFRIKKKYRARLLIKSDISSLIQKKIANILQSLVISKKIKLTVDVDPINFS